jgi:hypothetical protein
MLFLDDHRLASPRLASPLLSSPLLSSPLLSSPLLSSPLLSSHGVSSNSAKPSDAHIYMGKVRSLIKQGAPVNIERSMFINLRVSSVIEALGRYIGLT